MQHPTNRREEYYVTHGHGTSRSVASGGASGARPPPLKSVPLHFTFGPLVAPYIQYSVLKTCPPAAKSWRRAWAYHVGHNPEGTPPHNGFSPLISVECVCVLCRALSLSVLHSVRCLEGITFQIQWLNRRNLCVSPKSQISAQPSNRKLWT